MGLLRRNPPSEAIQLEMRFSKTIAAVLSWTFLDIGAHGATPSNESGIPMPDDFSQLQQTYINSQWKAMRDSGCDADDIRIRRSWDQLGDEGRSKYIDAVKCLTKNPATIDKSLVPGIVNRLDDFVFIHINQTLVSHQTGSFLPWHRLYLWEYENALRDECGFDGTVPYWDAPRFSDDQTKSKVFDGSETSLGGNGRYLPDDHGPYQIVVPGLAKNVSAVFSIGNGTGGTGGGCVEYGPFSEGQYEISLGPVDNSYVDDSNKFGLEANPRCLRRNFDPVSGSYLSWENATKVLSSPDIDTFRPLLSANFHKDTHGFIGRDGVDLFTPPNEPAFFMLHALIDRFWAIWQGQDLTHREYLLSGNRTFNGVPLETAPNAHNTNTTLEDVMWLRPGYEPTVRDGMSSSARGRCFIYV